VQCYLNSFQQRMGGLEKAAFMTVADQNFAG